MIRTISYSIAAIVLLLSGVCQAGPAPNSGVCNGDFEFVVKLGTHWEIGEAIQLVGPITGNNTLLMIVPDGYATAADVYIGQKTGPDTYQFNDVMIDGVSHQMNGVVSNDPDGCPFYIEFDVTTIHDERVSPSHPGHNDHGGHAGAANY